MATVTVDVTEATQRQRAFVALALAGGNSVKAAPLCGLGESTLRRWRREFSEEYERVRHDLAPQLERVAVSEAYARVVELGELEALAIRKLEAAIEEDKIPARDLPSALRNITTSKAINVDKILALSGRPTSVVEHRSAGELVRRLAALGAVVDGSATEIPELPEIPADTS